MDPNTPQGQSNTQIEQKIHENTLENISEQNLTEQVENLSLNQDLSPNFDPNLNTKSSPNSTKNFNESSANPENRLKRQESQNKRKLSNSEPQLRNTSENTSETPENPENPKNTSKSISQPLTKPKNLTISQNTPKLALRTRISAGGDPASRFRPPSTLDLSNDEQSTDEDGYIDDDEIIIQHRKRKLSIEFPTTDEDESDTDTTPSRYIGSHHRSSGLAQLEWDNNVSHNLSQNLENADGTISTSQTFSPVHSKGFNSNGLGKNQQKTKISSKYDGNNNKTSKKAYSNQSTPIKSSNGTSTTCSGSPALSSSQYQLVIVGEQEFRLDMKAIEPYKKVLSHGGYTGASGLTAVVIFTAAQLPDTVQHNTADYEYIMHNIFLYVVSTLDLLVAQDYVLIYLNGACKKRNLPGLSWLRQCYKMIDRRLRKSLKKLLIVHPTFYLRTLITIFRPFVSAKFSRKIHVCRNLEV